MHLIQSARTRLALTYLSIIMILSLGFSVLLYQQSTNVVGFGYRRQANQLRSNIYFAPPDMVNHIRDDGIHRFRNELTGKLILINFSMLIVGGFLSYYLAKRSLEPLEESIEAQSRFTSDAAHELRTPLTAMKTEIEVAIRSKKLQSKDAHDVLVSNLEEITKLELLIDSLLRLAKNGHLPNAEDWSLVKVHEVLKTATDRILPQANMRDITIKETQRVDVSIIGDKAQLIELFVVLLDNAVKYGTEKTDITINVAHNDKNITVTIRDKGIGIRPEDLPHIFERFYRADQSRSKSITSGYGLGLSVAQAIVATHKGTIVVHSKLGEGTSFAVTLPY
jgi:two-component system sensor histidine kinase CiaH